MSNLINHLTCLNDEQSKMPSAHGTSPEEVAIGSKISFITIWISSTDLLTHVSVSVLHADDKGIPSHVNRRSIISTQARHWLSLLLHDVGSPPVFKVMVR